MRNNPDRWFQFAEERNEGYLHAEILYCLSSEDRLVNDVDYGEWWPRISFLHPSTNATMARGLGGHPILMDVCQIG
tara:strand:+ start:100 stop:327 length:228 start_codon:yes stop_codon:yes gene_type:complete